MSDQIKPMQALAEIVAVVRNAEHLIDRLLGVHGIDARRIYGVDEELVRRGRSLSSELAELLYRIFMDWDRYRTQEIESLKKQNVELLNRLPLTMIFHEDCLTMPPEKESGK